MVHARAQAEAGRSWNEGPAAGQGEEGAAARGVAKSGCGRGEGLHSGISAPGLWPALDGGLWMRNGRTCGFQRREETHPRVWGCLWKPSTRFMPGALAVWNIWTV